MSIAAARTCTEAEAESKPSLVVDTEAVLSTGESAAGAAVVGVVMWTCLLAPLARVAKEQESTPPLTVQPVSELGASMLHDVPASGGRVSVTATPLARPGPEFDAVM